ncbi:MAG: hypothetical protein EOO48_01205 [Flavobacterium sp.]|nr:MAG: hypothetical protein EOO48_01205 [Flavobacterium sp.]
MTKSLLTKTSTLAVKLPENVELPSANQKIRAQKQIIKTMIQLLRSQSVELRYAGWKPADADYFRDNDYDGTIVVTINVIESSGKICDFETSADKLLKRFKMELLYNSEHIVIDSIRQSKVRKHRLIEIYTVSRHCPKKAEPAYIFPPSATRYHSRA